MEKKCDVILLSTNQKVHSVYMIDNLEYHKDHKISLNGIEQHLYFTSNEKIQEGDVCYNDYTNELQRWNKYTQSVFRAMVDTKHLHKIIATTDISLMSIKGQMIQGSYLPKPSQSFISIYMEKYNKGQAIKEVKVEYETDLPITCNSEGKRLYPNLKISPKDNTIIIIGI